MLGYEEEKDTVEEVIGNYKYTVAQADNYAYRNKIKQLMKSKKRQVENGTLSAEQDDALIAKAMAGTVLTGWEMTSSTRKGEKEIPFSVAKAEEILVNSKFRKMIDDVAQDFNRYIIEEEKETIKN